MQTNPYPIVAIAIESESSNHFVDIEQNQQHPTLCGCDMSSSTKKVGACICTDCKCHLKKRQTQDIVIPIPSPRIQCFGYGIIVSTVTIIAVYMLLQSKQ